MGLKNFDYKQLLIDRGERIGLGAAGVIALLLAASLFFPGMGFMSGSASSNADTLTTATKTVDAGLLSNKPTETDNPGDTKAKLVAFTFDILDHETAEKYGVPELFLPPPTSVASRQMPELLQPTDSRAEMVRLQLPVFIFEPDYPDAKRILVLDEASTSTTAGVGAIKMNNKAIFDLYKNAGRYNASGAEGSAAMMAPPRRKPNTHKGDGSDQEDLKSHFEDLTKIGSITDKKLAEEAYPVRAAEIVAAFPYKAQVQEFRDKLRLASDEQVLAEPSQELDKEKQPLPAFRFLGVRLQRRAVNAQGQPLDQLGKPTDDKGGWAEVNLEDSFKELVLRDGKRFKDEDPRLLAVELSPRLVMKKLVTFGDRREPPVEEYPKLEEAMPSIKATVETLNKNPNAAIAAPSIISKDFSVFDDVAPSGPPGMTPGVRPPTPGGSTPPGANFFRPPIGMNPTGGAKGPMGAEALQNGQTLTIPDYCLIRLFDVTVEPGKTYEYRMQVRMANPNFGREDAASQQYAHKEELPSKDNWYVLPEKVTAPLDVNYYAVDQAKVDAAAPKEVKDPSQPKEPKEPTRPLQVVKENQTVLQMQKWVETLKTKREEQPIGDWVIAERVVATRGEPIGPQKVEVPYWRKTQDRFTLLTDGPSKSGRRGPPFVDVSFSEGDEPILVDFTGGDATYKRAGQAQPSVDKNVAVDVLLVMPDGTLAAHDSAVDAADAKRVARLKENREWIHDVKNAKGGKDTNMPFGAPGT